MFFVYRVKYRLDTNDTKEYRIACVSAESEHEAKHLLTKFHIPDVTNPNKISLYFDSIEVVQKSEVVSFFEYDCDYKIVNRSEN